MKKNIVLLSGKAGSGKDTFAGFLGKDWERVSFADALKDCASALSELPLKYFNNRDLKDTAIYIRGELQTPRDFLICLSRFVRKINPNHWTDIAIEKIKKSTSKYIVITDWRFPHEEERLEEIFSGDQMVKKIIKVRIAGNNTLRSSDESECSLDNYDFDYTISNKSTLDALEDKSIMFKAIHGDSEAIGELYQRFLPRAVNICRKYCYNKSDLDDFSHECIMHLLYTKLYKYNFQCKPETFAYGYIWRTAKNKERTTGTYTKNIELSDTADVNYTSDLNKTKDYLLRDKLEEIISTLPQSDRDFFDLYRQGRDHSEIGEELGITENYSRTKLFRIKKKLKILLSDVYSEFV